MIIQVPETQAFGAALVVGWTQSAGAEALKGAVILKAAYDLTGTGGAEPFEMTPANDPARSDIVYADEGVILFEDGGAVHEIAMEDLRRDDAGAVFFEIGGTAHPVAEADGFDLTYEADIALGKARTDIVVAGHTSGTKSGAVAIAGSQWIRRNEVDKQGDTARNLFGWLPKSESPRRLTVPDDFRPEEGDRLPADYGSRFNNFHRRGGGFSTPANRNRNPLPSRALVEVHKSADGSDAEPFAFVLPDLGYRARYRAYCGHGPDEAPYWRIGEIGTLRPDTLIVRPEARQATILWRASWDWGAEPEDTYRKIQILEGSA